MANSIVYFPQIIFGGEERDCAQRLECNQERSAQPWETGLIQTCDSSASEFPAQGLAPPSRNTVNGANAYSLQAGGGQWDMPGTGPRGAPMLMMQEAGELGRVLIFHQGSCGFCCCLAICQGSRL